MTDLVAAHEIPDPIYPIPYKINYVAKLFDFKFADFFIKEEYPKIQDIVIQHLWPNYYQNIICIRLQKLPTFYCYLLQCKMEIYLLSCVALFTGNGLNFNLIKVLWFPQIFFCFLESYVFDLF